MHSNAQIVPFVPPPELCRGPSLCAVRENLSGSPVTRSKAPREHSDALCLTNFLQTCNQYNLATTNRGPVAAFNAQRRSPFVLCDVVSKARGLPSELVVWFECSGGH